MWRPATVGGQHPCIDASVPRLSLRCCARRPALRSQHLGPNSTPFPADPNCQPVQISDHLSFAREDSDETKVKEIGEILSVGDPGAWGALTAPTAGQAGLLGSGDAASLAPFTGSRCNGTCVKN